MWMCNYKTYSKYEESLPQITEEINSHTQALSLQKGFHSNTATYLICFQVYTIFSSLQTQRGCGSGSDGSTKGRPCSSRRRQWPSGAPRTWRSPTPTPAGLNTTICKLRTILASYSHMWSVPLTERHPHWRRQVCAGKWTIPGSKGEREEVYGGTLAPGPLKTSGYKS